MEDQWLEKEPEDESDDFSIDEYDLTASPNDFNVKTIVEFINQGVFQIPAFQRNYVWDNRRASKLIESLIIGLPVPQIFLYEEKRNQFLVIDGQQRLMSIYYFVKKRFPKMEMRTALRRIFDESGRVPSEALADDRYFENFNLHLPAREQSQDNKLDRLNYETLGDYKTTLDLRTVRCVVVKQNKPQNDDSSVYEIFNRLNTGGVNLTAQEIRTSLYHSDFYNMLYRLNVDSRWRLILGTKEPDLNMRDVEILLRGFAMLNEGSNYKPPMTRFLNQYSKNMRSADSTMLNELEARFHAFLSATSGLPEGSFSTRAKAINISVFDAIFAAVCNLASKRKTDITLDPGSLTQLKEDKDFVAAVSSRSTDRKNVETRLARAEALLRAVK